MEVVTVSSCNRNARIYTRPTVSAQRKNLEKDGERLVLLSQSKWSKFLLLRTEKVWYLLIGQLLKLREQKV